MTAEVALLNTTAVALAADSAMTLGGSNKTYPAQKLFALTKHHPVGVMIYNNAQFMGIPWETLIKMYRHSLGSKSHPSIEAYVDDFFGFVGRAPFTNAERELENLLRMARGAFLLVRSAAGLPDDSTGGDDALLQEVIEQQRAVIARWSKSPSMNEVDVAQVVVDSHRELDRQIDSMFGEDLVTPPIKEALRGLVEDLILSSVTTSAQIVPFAQSEMVTRFMEGVDPAFLDYLQDSMGETSRQLVMEVLESMGIECSEEDAKTVREAAAKQADRFLQETADVRQRNFVAPIMDVVEHLPKEELADMAEALVNLTALKRRVSLDLETVGGPIDVAVISKGDGLIWIKRKHYFDPALNPRYVSRHP